MRESVSAAAGWRQAAPWLIVAIPASLILGAIAALLHKRGIIGEICLAAPIALSLPEAFISLKIGAVILIPIVAFDVLLIHMTINERPVRAVALLVAIAALLALGIVLFPVVWFLLLGRF